MSIDKTQLRDLIRTVLKEVDKHAEDDEPKLYSEDAEELLMLTCAQESLLGTYIKQGGNGPAIGILQMEPNTYWDLINTYLVNRKSLKGRIEAVVGPLDSINDLKFDLACQIIFARLLYLRAPGNIPNKNDLRGMANYYKKYYNTYLGKATIAETVKNYKKYVMES